MMYVKELKRLLPAKTSRAHYYKDDVANKRPILLFILNFRIN